MPAAAGKSRHREIQYTHWRVARPYCEHAWIGASTLLARWTRTDRRCSERALCTAEIDAARRVFGTRIDYARVRVVNGKYGWLHHPRYVICPNGRIYWPEECGDLAGGEGGMHLRRFIHEMTHVLQHQHGVPVLRKGLVLHAVRLASFGLYDPYRYRYVPGKAFSRYNIEQQAQIAVGIFDGRHPDIIDYGS